MNLIIICLFYQMSVLLSDSKEIKSVDKEIKENKTHIFGYQGKYNDNSTYSFNLFKLNDNKYLLRDYSSGESKIYNSLDKWVTSLKKEVVLSFLDGVFKLPEVGEPLKLRYFELKENKNNKDNKFIEPMFDPSRKRLALYPIKNQRVWNWYKKHQSSHWFAKEIDFKEDAAAFAKLNKREQHFIKTITAFFGSSDFVVNELVEQDSMDYVELEHCMFNDYKKMMENVHSETYADNIKAFNLPPKEEEELFRAIETSPSIKKKAEWIRKWIKGRSPVHRLVAGVIQEGVCFSGSFCGIFYLKNRQKGLNGTFQANEQISRDERIHYSKSSDDYVTEIQHKLPKEEVIKMFKEAVAIEHEFIKEALPNNNDDNGNSTPGMDSDKMLQYIKHTADNVLYGLIGETIYNVSNPFDWMAQMSMNKNVNFFEKLSTQYTHTSEIVDASQNKVRFDEKV